MTELTEYRVLAGKKDFKPNDQRTSGQREVYGEFMFTESMWFDWKNWEHHPYDGLCKIGAGLTWSLSLNDNRSGMFAYFPDKNNKNRFNIYAYRNDHKGKHSFWPMANIGIDVRHRTRFSWVGGQASWELWRKDDPQAYKGLTKN